MITVEKNYRLHGGERGTEYEAVLECIRYWERKKLEVEETLASLYRRRDNAVGRSDELPSTR